MYNRLNHKINVCHLTSKTEIKHKSFQGVELRIHENDQINIDPQDPASSRSPGSRAWHSLATCLRAASRVYWTTFITWGTNLRSLGSTETFLDVFYWKEIYGCRTQETWIIREKASWRQRARQGLKTQECSLEWKQAAPSPQNIADSVLGWKAIYTVPANQEESSGL